MTKQKSTLVTALVMALLGAIAALMLIYWHKGLVVFGGMFAIYGCSKFAEAFYSWLSYKPESKLEVPMLAYDAPTDEESEPTLESVMAEMGAYNG